VTLPGDRGDRSASNGAGALNPLSRARGALLYRRAKRDGPLLELGMRSRSQTMLVAFGGIHLRSGVPPYEFSSLTGRTGVKRLYVRDVRQAWYHRGIPGHGDRLMDVAAALRAVVARHRVERLVVVGNSAGGYAALVFGTLLAADVVLAFSPQTVLDLDTLARIDDHRWDEMLQPLERDAAFDRAWVDLASALPTARHAETQYRVFFDDTHLDRVHCERLTGIEGVRLLRFGGGEHELARALRENGALARVVEHAIRPA
jgi:pimeloyl-ACP methyl ester carboxylesterase